MAGRTPTHWALSHQMKCPVDAETLATAFETEFGAPLIYPPQSLRETLLQGGFSDNNHLNIQGRALYGPWLGQAVAETLDDALIQ